MGEYLYNEKAGTLHIRGYCQHTRGASSEYKVFATRNDAIAYGKCSVRFCRICEKKREQKLQSEKQ